jgi:hypothetical protein
MITLPILAIALLVYHSVRAFNSARARREESALRISAARASDLEQWRSIDC